MARWTGDTIAPNTRAGDAWGHQVRSYVVGRGVKDLRTGVTADFDRTLDGDIDQFLKAALEQGCGTPDPNAAVPD